MQDLFAPFPPQPSRWIPSIGETYFFVLGNGSVQRIQWHGTRFDLEAWTFGNCFRVRREAIQARDLLQNVLLRFHQYSTFR